MIAAIYIRTSREFKGVERVSTLQQATDAKQLAASAPKDAPLLVEDANIIIDENRSGSYPPEQWGDLASISPKTGKPSKQRRQGLTRLINLITSGQVNAVICRKRNRLARSFEIHRKLANLFKQYNIKLYCTHETMQQGDDTTSEFSCDILALLAEFQLKQSRDDVLAAKKYSKDHGRKMSWVQSVGYSEGGPQKVLIVKEEKELVNKIYKMYLAGSSTHSIVRWLNDNYPAEKIISGKNRTRWHSLTVKNLLTNPCYIGMARNSQGDLIKSNAYAAIVPVAVWTQVQERIKATRNIKHGSRYTQHLFGGVLICHGCGNKLAIHRETNTLANGSEVVYYTFLCPIHKTRCPVKSKSAYIREIELDLWAERYLAHAVPVDVGEQSNQDIATLLLKRGELEHSLQQLRQRTDVPLDASLTRDEAYRKAISEIDRKIETIRGKQISSIKKWDDMDIEEKRMRIKELTIDIRVGREFVFLRFKDTLKYDKDYYSRLDLLNIDFTEDDPEYEYATFPPMAFPIMHKYINRHWRNALVPDDPTGVCIRYIKRIIDGLEYTIPDWKESYEHDGEQHLVLNSQFRETPSPRR